MYTRRALGVALALTILMLLAGGPVAAQRAVVIHEENHGLSAPMRTMPYKPLTGRRALEQARIPNAHPPSMEDVTYDPGLQEKAYPLVNTTPGLKLLGLGVGFPGITSDTYAPPDTNAAVGATQIVETVNTVFAVFDKATGAIVAGPASLGNLWNGVDANCAGTSTQFTDPVVVYDQQAGRWVIQLITESSPFKICMAVSTTSDATGTYNAYAFIDPAGLPDYDKLAVWTDAYYTSVRQFNANETEFLGPNACASDRTAMLTGSAATMQCVQITNSGLDGMLPANLDGATPPPAGSPEYFLLIPLPDAGTASTLQLYQFHYVSGGGSTLTGPATITVNKYKEASSFGGFVPQLGTTQKLDGLGYALMHRLAYRNFTGTNPHESLVVTHNVAMGSGSTLRYAPRWYEIRSPGTTPVVYQQGTYSPDTTTYRWTGSIAMDKAGNIALGYSVSSPTISPGIRYTGRTPSQTLGKMQGESTILSGAGSQEGFLDRWGDYSSMAIDPSDDCTFWYANEYLQSTGSFNWSTSLFSFKFPSCR